MSVETTTRGSLKKFRSPVEHRVLRGFGVGGRCLARAMSTTSRLPFDRLDAALDEVAMVDPIYLTTTEKQEALTGWSRLIARAQAQQLRVLACAEDIAEVTGDRSTAHWLARESRDHPGTLRRHAMLADALDRRWTAVADAFVAGKVNLSQVRVIVEAL